MDAILRRQGHPRHPTVMLLFFRDAEGLEPGGVRARFADTQGHVARVEYPVACPKFKDISNN